MTNHEKYKIAFNCIKAPESVSLIRNNDCSKKVFQYKKMIVVLACTALIIGLGITAYANYDKISNIIHISDSNMVLITTVEENGDSSVTALVQTDDLIEPVVEKNGKYFFVVNNENIDITDEINDNNYYQYEYKDSADLLHIWIVGLLPDETDNFGYAEYVKDSDGQWLTGYSAKINIEPDGSTNCKWLETAKEINGIPW